MASRIEKVMEWAEELSTGERIELHNAYCNENRYTDDYINDMDVLDECLSGMTPTEILNAVDDDFNTNDDYFTEGIYGLKSYSWDIDDVLENYWSTILQMIADGEDFGLSHVRDFIRDLDSEEEES